MTPTTPKPVYFGTGLFGWLHRPDGPHQADVGLVICNPFGFEEVCAHRSLRHLAESAAAAGMPTLRFDYSGSGNSAGDEFQSDMLGRWRQSIHEAVEGLKQASGVRKVCLVGLRLGSLLATLTAHERTDVAGLVLIAPVVRGRAYLRELTALAQTGAGEFTEAPRGGPLESAGFVMSEETRTALTAIDLHELEQAPAAHILIVERDDLPGTASWPAMLERLGAQVSVASWPGYLRMMDDPQRAQVPVAIVDGVLRQVAQWCELGAQAMGADRAWGHASQTLWVGAAAPHRPLLETAVQIDGGESTLFAVLARPASDEVTPGPAVLMLSAGSVHAIGPNRLWVRLARRWAAQGVTVLRLDISGIGDSPPRPGSNENIVYSPHALQDIGAALRYLKGLPGVGACHLLGLCSGAYHAFKAAVAGHVAASVVMINPLTFSWHEGDRLSDVKEYEIFALTSKYRGKFFTREPWRKLVRGHLDWRLIREVALRRISGLAAPQLIEVARWLRLPQQSDLLRDLKIAANHGVTLRFIYAEGAPGFALMRKQSGHAITRLQASQAATLDFVAGADHTFTRVATRESLVQLLDLRLWPGRVRTKDGA